MQAYTAQKLKSENRLKAFLLLAKGKVFSKSELASALGLSAPTAGKIVDSFLEKGIVRRVQAEHAERGRPPFLVELDARSYYNVGVTLEGAFIKAGVTNLNNELVAVLARFCAGRPLEAVLENDAVTLVNELLNGAGIERERVMGLGLGLPAICDVESSVVVAAPLMGVNEPLSIAHSLHVLSEAVGCPVLFDNDTNMAALGEHLSRAGADNMLFVTLGTGLGAAIVLNGTLLRGSRNRAGEIGYARLFENPEGQNSEAGWLENSININAVCEILSISSLHALQDAGEEARLQAAEHVSSRLAPCLALAALTLDVALIPVSGLLPAAIGAPFFDALNARLERLTPFETLAVPASSPHVDSIGAAGAAFSKYLSSMLLND